MTSTYTCHAFHDSLPGGRSSGTLVVHREYLLFSIGEQTLQLATKGIEMNMGGASNRLIFFSHKDHPGWSFYTNQREILKDNILRDHPHASSVLRGAERHHLRSWTLLSVVAVLIVAVPIFLLLRMDTVMKVAVKKIPAEWEASLGESVIAQQRMAQQFMDEEKTSELIAPLVAPLLNARGNQRYTYRFHIVNEPSINAMALPGGEIIIHSALILEADGAEELLGVLAHEMVHVEYQHGMRNVAAAAGIYVIASAIFGDLSGVLAAISSAVPVLINQNYSRKFEEEADREGFNLLVRANIDPHGLHDFFHRLKLQEAESLKDISDEDTQELVNNVMTYLSSHPATDKRIAMLSDLLESQKPDNKVVNLANEFQLLQQVVSDFTHVSKLENTAYEE